MDIAFVNRMVGISRGGGEIWDLKMARKLEEMGADVTFYVGKPLRAELPEPIEDFASVEIPTPHLQELAYAAPKGVGGLLADVDAQIFCRRAAKEVQKRDHDIVQICSRPEFGRYVDEIETPVSVVMHGDPYSLWYDVIKPWGSTYELLDAFDQIIAVGGASDAIQTHVSRSIQTINPGVDTQQFTPKNSQSTEHNGRKAVLFVGRFVPVKNIPLLIEAFDSIIHRHPDAELVLVGDGPKRETIEQAVMSRGLEKCVRFLGYIPNEDLPDVYRRATVFALSSRSEAHPITLLEAMSCGTPVVGPAVGAVPEIIDDGRTGFIYEKENMEELATVLDQLLADEHMCVRLGEEGRKTAVDQYGWGRQAQKLRGIYNSLSQEG